MQEPRPPASGSRARRMAIGLAVCVALLAAILAALWLVAPLLISRSAPLLGPRFGAQDLQLTVASLDRNTALVRDVRFQYGDAAIAIGEIHLRFEALALLAGQTPDIEMRDVELVLTSPDSARAQAVTPADPSPSLQPLDVLEALAAIPDLRARPLHLVVEDLGVSASGEFLHRDGAVQFGMTVAQPEELDGMLLRGDVTRGGLVTLAWLDPARAAAPLATVRSQIDAAQIAMAAEFDVSGYALALASRLAGISAGAGRLQGSGSLQLPTPVQQLTDLTFDGRATLDWRAADGSIDLEGLDVSASGDWHSARVRMAGGQLKLRDVGTTLAFPNGAVLVREDAAVTLSSGRLPFAAGVDGDLRTSGTVDAARVAWSGDGIHAVFGLDLHGYVVPLDLRYSAAGVLAARSSGRVRVRQPLLAALLDTWDAGFDVVAGTLEYELDMTMADGLRGSFRPSVRAADLQWGTDVLRGIAGRAVVDIGGGGIVLRPTRVTATSAEFGLTTSDIEMTVAYDQSAAVLSVTDAKVSLLGGTASAERIAYDLNAERTSFIVELNALDLAQVLALEGDHIRGTGSLQGTLPLDWTTQGVRIQKGVVRAAGGGTIQLSPSLAHVTGQPGLDFATRALTDFKYDTLAAEADFAVNGDLALAVKLHGSNPAVEKGRAIHYNLNITENVYDLLDSLRAQRTVTDSVTRKVTN